MAAGGCRVNMRMEIPMGSIPDEARAAPHVNCCNSGP